MTAIRPTRRREATVDPRGKSQEVHDAGHDGRAGSVRNYAVTMRLPPQRTAEKRLVQTHAHDAVDTTCVVEMGADDVGAQVQDRGGRPRR